MENNTLEKILKQYRDFKSKYQGSLILLRDGDFYKAFENDAKDMAFALGITLMTNKGINAAMFPCNTLDVNLPRLVRSGFKVAICEALQKVERVTK